MVSGAPPLEHAEPCELAEVLPIGVVVAGWHVGSFFSLDVPANEYSDDVQNCSAALRFSLQRARGRGEVGPQAVGAESHPSESEGWGTRPTRLSNQPEFASWDNCARRLWSLWEIMNLFDVQGLAYVLHNFSQLEAALFLAKVTGNGGHKPDKDLSERMTKALDFAEVFFKNHRLKHSLRCVAIAKHQWNRPVVDNSSTLEIVHRIQVDIVTDLEKRMLLIVDGERAELIDRDDLFGVAAKEAFVSASEDIKESGNCLAAECNTAAVFHMMRAAEVALRALAKDRDVIFKDKPLEQKEWGEILGALEGKVKDLRLGDSKRWSKPEIREVQIRFYNEVLQELRGFNEVWRRHLSHVHEGSLYDRDYAMSVFNHVRAFMQKLAGKISEDTITPEFWNE